MKPKFSPAETFQSFVPEEVLAVLDGGRAYHGNQPPETIRFGDKEIANFRRSEPP